MSKFSPQLIAQVQRNCHISDALYARDYSLCIYLLKMREFYRWEQGIDFGEPLPKGPLGEWLTAREQLWETLAADEYASIAIGDSQHEPFASPAINQLLISDHLIYSAGYCGEKPHFFLAELESHEEYQGTQIYIAGHELAREITAPPALSLGNTVFLRRESLKRMIWEKLEEWGWQDPNRAIARAAGFYHFEANFTASLEAMTQDELDTLLKHELGEVACGQDLGPDWERMLVSLPRSRAAFHVRAIRDHLVDCRYTLPALLEEGREAAIHFYMANFTTMRKAIFPALSQAYEQWLEGDGGKAYREVLRRAADYWLDQAEACLALYHRHGDDEKGLRKALDELADSQML